MQWPSETPRCPSCWQLAGRWSPFPGRPAGKARNWREVHSTNVVKPLTMSTALRCLPLDPSRQAELSGQHGRERRRGDGSHVPSRLRAGASAAAFLAQTACTVVPSHRLLSETGWSGRFSRRLNQKTVRTESTHARRWCAHSASWVPIPSLGSLLPALPWDGLRSRRAQWVCSQALPAPAQRDPRCVLRKGPRNPC